MSDLSNKTIAFLCCARNVSEYITTTFNNLKNLSNPFKKSYIYIYENDSSDDTLNILQELKNKHDLSESTNINLMASLIKFQFVLIAYHIHVIF